MTDMLDPEDRDALFAHLRDTPDAVPQEDEAQSPERVQLDAPVRTQFQPTVPSRVVIYDEVPASMIVRLRYPVTVDGLHVVEIGLRPPAFADVEAVLSGAISEIDMQGRMGGVPVDVLRALRWPDVEAVTVAARHLAPEMGAR